MLRLYVNPESCQVCPACFAARACNIRAILRIDLEESPVLDTSRCYHCLLCIPACPYGAIVLDGVSPPH